MELFRIARNIFFSFIPFNTSEIFRITIDYVLLLESKSDELNDPVETKVEKTVSQKGLGSLWNSIELFKIRSNSLEFIEVIISL